MTLLEYKKKRNKEYHCRRLDMDVRRGRVHCETLPCHRDIVTDTCVWSPTGTVAEVYINNFSLTLNLTTRIIKKGNTKLSLCTVLTDTTHTFIRRQSNS